MADLIKYAFVAGELSPKLYSRSDLEKYDLAVAQAENWFVDYTGGISTRPGQHFVDLVLHDDQPVKFFPFRFAPSVAQTYGLVMGHQYIRFIQDKQYVLEADKTITGITGANPGVVTSNAHGFNNGDWVKPVVVGTMADRLNGQTFAVANKTANTFELTDPLTGANIDLTGLAFTSGVVARIYTLASPYDADDLETLRAHQSGR